MCVCIYACIYALIYEIIYKLLVHNPVFTSLENYAALMKVIFRKMGSVTATMEQCMFML
jgi:hypothetical protein